MRKFFLALTSFAFVATHAQTVDEIIQKYTTAAGGLDAFNAIKTAKITGTVSVQGTDLTITVQIINGRAMRNDIEFMGQSVINSYKDGKGWSVNPLAGVTTPTEATGAALTDLKNQSSLASPLMNYKTQGNQVELLGQEDVNGVKAFKIKLTAKEDGKVTTYFISTTDYMIIKSIDKKEIQGQELELETYYSDFKEFGGIKLSTDRITKVEDQVIQEIKFTSVEMNVPVDEKIFDMPK